MAEDKLLLDALYAVNPAELSYEEWVEVGMALKAAGYDCALWDDWSKNDHRYKTGGCAKKWRSFNSTGVNAGSIVDLAKKRFNWTPGRMGGELDWNAVIEYDGDEPVGEWNPADDLIRYLNTLFMPHEKVSYVMDAYEMDGRLVPAAGCWDRTAGELIDALKDSDGDIGAVFGDWDKNAGAWIRMNPVDGERRPDAKGMTDDNITDFRFALVESDAMTLQEQESAYRRHELPIAALVSSGNKSVHAIVRVDAKDAAEYDERVEKLHTILESKGVAVDRSNRNPSRLSRMPGITRGEKRQQLLAVNIGCKSWVDWLDFIEGVKDELPEIEDEDEGFEYPELAPDLIEGVLRVGHKCLIAGPSKAGKSFALLELAICIAEGRPWMGLNVKKGKVLYVNLEIDPASLSCRLLNIRKARELTEKTKGNLKIWNLRGHAVPLDQLVDKLIRRVENEGLLAVIIDPIYKVITGDENNASDMGHFCNQFDRICASCGCASIYAHHFTKGAQGGKKAIDRASGSGVFARDPDAVITLTELVLNDHIKANYADDGASGWRCEFSLREYPYKEPLDVWFRHPLHQVDTEGVLAEMGIEGSPEAASIKAGGTTPSERLRRLNDAYEFAILNLEKGCSTPTLEQIRSQIINQKTGKAYSEQSIRDWVAEHGEYFQIVDSKVYRLKGIRQ